MHEAMTKIEARALLVGHNASANALWLLSGLIVFLPWVLTPLARRVIALPQAQEAFRSMGGETAALMMVFVISCSRWQLRATLRAAQSRANGLVLAAERQKRAT